jgi:5'-methylthioadenosine nucleosidase
MQIRKVMLLVAMQKEALPIIKKMNMKILPESLDKYLPAEAYETVTDKGRIILVVSGKCTSHKVDRIGSQGLNLVAWEALKKFEPDILINPGTGGGFQRNESQPGDIYLSGESIKYHDRLFYPDMFFLNYGIGSYKCLEIPYIAKKIGAKVGVISTGASMLASTQEEKQMIENKAVVKEMEAAGIAEVAQMRGIPFIALKIITDLVDTHECPQNQFTNNFDKLISHLATKCQEICSLILGENLENFLGESPKNIVSNNKEFKT